MKFCCHVNHDIIIYIALAESCMWKHSMHVVSMFHKIKCVYSIKSTYSPKYCFVPSCPRFHRPTKDCDWPRTFHFRNGGCFCVREETFISGKKCRWEPCNTSHKRFLADPTVLLGGFWWSIHIHGPAWFLHNTVSKRNENHEHGSVSHNVVSGFLREQFPGLSCEESYRDKRWSGVASRQHKQWQAWLVLWTTHYSEFR